MTASPGRLEQIRAALQGRYDIDRPVGEGGMAVVWVAHDVKHDRRVAVKLLRRELSLSLGAERFAREIRIAAKLNHPNIVGVIDSGVIEIGGAQLPYYVMPLVEGPSLRDLLEREGPMALDVVLRLAAEVADALDFAHARGVVHRDVKPGNILIQADHALVADFGIARAIDVAAGGTVPATTESVVGTPIYMSPEQCRGESQVDGRSDIYSLGCVMYEMLTGHPPFEAHTPQAVSIAHCNTPVPPLDERRPGLPLAVQRLVARTLAKAPSDRFGTAGELRRELERVRTRTSAPTEIVPRVATGRRRLALAGITAVALVALFWRGVARRGAAGIQPSGDAIVVLDGVRDRTGALGDEGSRLDDAMREELQRVPGLRVVDVSDQPELPPDSLRRRFGADWIVRGTLDRGGDSVGLSMRMLDARTGLELGGASRWRPDVASLRRDAVLLEETSPFALVRRTLASQMRERRLVRLESDSGVLALRARALVLQGNAERAFYELGPSRALAVMATADSLLVEAEHRRTDGVVATIQRAHFASYMAAIAEAGRQRFPDSSGLPRPQLYLERGLASANTVVARAPALADGWLLRAQLTEQGLGYARDSSVLQRVLADFRQANKLDPNRADVWLAQSAIEQGTGDLRSALYSIRRAQEADRLHSLGAYLDYKRFEVELGLERYDSAAAACAAGASRYPQSALLRACGMQLAGLRSSSPRDASAALVLADSLAGLEQVDLPPTYVTELRLFAAAILWRAGLADSGERVYSEAIDDWGENVDGNELASAAYARTARGDVDSALALLARAVRVAPQMAPTFMRSPRYAPLRRDPAFGLAMQGIPPSEVRTR